MSSENFRNAPPQAVTVSTVYPGNYQGVVTYGFQHPQVHPQVHPQAPPPKYEDVVNERTNYSEPHRTYEGTEQTVIYIAPVKYSATQKILAIVFIILFLFGFLSIIFKVINFH